MLFCVPFLWACTGADFSVDYFQTISTALHHRSVDLEVDHNSGERLVILTFLQHIPLTYNGVKLEQSLHLATLMHCRRLCLSCPVMSGDCEPSELMKSESVWEPCVFSPLQSHTMARAFGLISDYLPSKPKNQKVQGSSPNTG